MMRWRSLWRAVFPPSVQPLASRPSRDEAMAYAHQALRRGRLVIVHQDGQWLVSRVGR